MKRWTGLLLAAVLAGTLMSFGCAGIAGGSQAGVAAMDTELPVIPDDAVGRAITWENPTGAVGAGGQAGGGRKGAPCIPRIRNGQTQTLMDVEGCGVIRHIWITIPDRSVDALRNMILRMYWDGSEVPSVEVPFGDFFGVAHGRTVDYSSAYTTETLGRGFNCYYPMPFRKHAKITVENDMANGKDMSAFFFQIDYELRDALPANTGYFHAQFHRQNPTTKLQDFVVLEGAEGPGMFIGCVIGIRPLGPYWWGEGEMKFYMDGDTDYPTICGTGTEDYFNAAWGMGEYVTPYHGCPLYMVKNKQFEHGLISMYRWHEKDPVYFRESFKATIQQMGHHGGLFERSDDWCGTAFWYQAKPISEQPELPNKKARTADLLPLPKKKG